jgi:hypothetical protein
VELLYASVPNTMYNVNDGANVIGFSHTSDTTGNVNLTTLSSGFYDTLNLPSAVYSASQVYSNVTVTYLSGEGKFLFTRPTSFTMDIMTKELASLMGFDFPCSINATDSVGSPYANNLTYKNQWYIKSTYVAEMNLNEGVFIDIQELRTMYNECAPMGSPYATTVNNTANRSFGMIPMDVPSGFIKRFKKAADYDLEIQYPYPIQKLDRLTVSWTDKNGNLLSFNGANDNSVILRFHTLRKNLC